MVGSGYITKLLLPRLKLCSHICCYNLFVFQLYFSVGDIYTFTSKELVEHVRKVPVHPPSTSWYPCFFGWYWTPLQESVRYQKKYNSLRGFWGPLKKLGSKCLYWSLEKPYDHAIHLFICFLRRRIHFRYQFSLIDSSNAVGALFFLTGPNKKNSKKW